MSILRFLRRFSMSGKLALAVFLLFFFVAVFANLLSPHSAFEPSAQALQPPSGKHWLGSDDLGIDLWAQLVQGTRNSLLIGLGTACLAGLGGALLGMLSSYKGGWIDRLIMWLTDTALALPSLPIMIVCGAFFGPSLFNILLVLTLFSWMTPARLVRTKALALREEPYVWLSRSYGASFWHIITRHFLPSLTPLMLVSCIRLVNRAVIAEASLSYLGLGDPLSRSWGLLMHHAVQFKNIYYTPFWKWWVISPLAALILFVVSLALLARELEKKPDLTHV
ncbi:putative D,D-dipeptide transport system permease protein DdpC [compost metagenome]